MGAVLPALAGPLLVVAALAVTYRPLGDLLAHVFTSPRHWRVERAVYRLIGVDPDADQRWPVYLRSVLAFSSVSVVGLYLLLRTQHLLPWAQGTGAVPAALAWNTAVSFVTNTNWQNYAGESTLGHVAQAAGLTVQNFASAAVGMAVAVALVRGFAREGTDRLGVFWVDLVRGVVRVLLPAATVSAVLLVAAGVVQNFAGPTTVHTLAGLVQTLPGGPVASQEAVKLLGTNGGGFFNANSAHPFENPDALTNLFQVYLMLALPTALPRAFGRMVGDHRQGYAVVSVMGVFWAASVALTTWAESRAAGAATAVAGQALEGKEVRFGIPGSTLFAASTTMTSTGAVNSMHDSYTALGGGVTLAGMMTGEVAPGGVGSGLYGMLVLAVIAVFVGGLMVGRTPEYLRKKLGAREMKLASLYILVTPVLVLGAAAVAVGVPGLRAAATNDGAHAITEILYGFTSMGNNNGSAFAGLGAGTDWYNTVGAVVMLLGRFLPMVFVVALAGSLAQQRRVPVTGGTLPTHGPLFAGLLGGVVVLLVALTYFPTYALGPLAEAMN